MDEKRILKVIAAADDQVTVLDVLRGLGIERTADTKKVANAALYKLAREGKIAMTQPSSTSKPLWGPI
jgi:hypothetical protein